MNKIDIQKKYKTRHGIPVKILCTNVKGEYPVVVLIEPKNDRAYTYMVDELGSVEMGSCKFSLVEILDNDPDVGKSFKQGEIILVSNDCKVYSKHEFLFYDAPNNAVWCRTEQSGEACNWSYWKSLEN